MSLTKYRLGDLIEKIEERCKISDLTINDVSGINREKEFFEPSKQVGKDTSNYKYVPVRCFATNLMHVGRDVVLPVAFNHSKTKKIVSPAYTIFRLKEAVKILDEYLFMYFNSKEKDRYFWFFTDASIRDGLSWEDFCNIEIELPPLYIQKKYVSIYKAMLENQESYEKGLEDLKIVCDSTIDRFKNTNMKSLSEFLEERNERNSDCEIDLMKGIGLQGFISPNQKRSKESKKKCKIFHQNDFVYAPSSLKNGVIWINRDYKKAICTEEYITFYNKKEEKLNSYYLLLLLKRPEFSRYIEFLSLDSVRNRFYFKDIVNIEIPIPSMEIQNSIANIYKVYNERKKINEKLKDNLKNICPILIKGAVEEASRREA